MAKIKGWKNTSKTFSDGSKSIEWRSKSSIVSIHNSSFTDDKNAWVFSVRPLKEGRLMPNITDTNNTKPQAYRKAHSYMRKHPRG